MNWVAGKAYILYSCDDVLLQINDKHNLTIIRDDIKSMQKHFKALECIEMCFKGKKIFNVLHI